MAFGIATCGRFGLLLTSTGIATVLNAILAEDKVFARKKVFFMFQKVEIQVALGSEAHFLYFFLLSTGLPNTFLCSTIG